MKNIEKLIKKLAKKNNAIRNQVGWVPPAPDSGLSGEALIIHYCFEMKTYESHAQKGISNIISWARGIASETFLALKKVLGDREYSGISIDFHTDQNDADSIGMFYRVIAEREKIMGLIAHEEYVGKFEETSHVDELCEVLEGTQHD